VQTLLETREALTTTFKQPLDILGFSHFSTLLALTMSTKSVLNFLVLLDFILHSLPRSVTQP
jgi:hypothetical protein